ncbi:hypothetical protein Tco_0522162 [Tanacetum coccineum]
MGLMQRLVFKTDLLNQGWQQDFEYFTQCESSAYRRELLENLDTLEAVIHKVVNTYGVLRMKENEVNALKENGSHLIVSKGSLIEPENRCFATEIELICIGKVGKRLLLRGSKCAGFGLSGTVIDEEPFAERSLLHDNIVPKPDLALELGKSISLTEAEEEAVAREPGTGGSNEGTGNILGVPDESTIVSRASSEGTGSKLGVPDEEKLILEWEADVDSEHFDRDDNADPA